MFKLPLPSTDMTDFQPAVASIPNKNSYGIRENTPGKEPLFSNTAFSSGKTRSNNSRTIIGSDQALLAVLEIAALVSKRNSTVLIEGETGTGKEGIANSIHEQSKRNNRDMIRVNCGALSESILESELFGHEKGAFTGAFQERKGRFELAHESTIFLDEIGDISPAMQIKLLRVLQEREFERVGGSRSIKSDVRIIAATNKILIEEVDKGNFRSDLYYRLNVINIKMPALRERRGDIPELSNFLLQKYCKDMNVDEMSFSKESMALMMSYNWPGNIRELDNIIERIVVLSKSNIVKVNDLLFTFIPSKELPPATYKQAMDHYEKKFLESSLKQYNYNISKMARHIQLARTNIYEKIKKHNIDHKASLR